MTKDLSDHPGFLSPLNCDSMGLALIGQQYLTKFDCRTCWGVGDADRQEQAQSKRFYLFKPVPAVQVILFVI